jgi:hypothetical protein
VNTINQEPVLQWQEGPLLTASLNAWGKQGWQLVSSPTNMTDQGVWLLLILKRLVTRQSRKSALPSSQLNRGG